MIKHDPYINKIIFLKYKIEKQIGKGSFGTVYQGKSIETEEKVAIKIEKKERNNSGTLETEAYRLIYLQGEGIPKIYCYGNNQSHNMLVEELLGRSLESIFNSFKKFSLKTVCVLGIEMIKRIRFVHDRHHIHRDIKPDNFTIGIKENMNKIYIIDFGLAKKYFSITKKQHIPFCRGKHLVGTARYCGRNAHRGYEQGRRDDIESIGYVLIYFIKGKLPWQGLKFKKTEEQYEKIANIKYETSFEELTQNLPEEFLDYFKHCDELEFTDKPDYNYLIHLFQQMIDKYCRDQSYDYDWQKDSITHYPSNLGGQDLNKSRDISLIVNNNNNVSSIGSKEENIGDSNIFKGEDNQPYYGNNELNGHKKAKMNRSRSLINIDKSKEHSDNSDYYKDIARKRKTINNNFKKINKFSMESESEEKDTYKEEIKNNNCNNMSNSNFQKVSSERKKGSFRKDVNEFPNSIENSRSGDINRNKSDFNYGISQEEPEYKKMKTIDHFPNKNNLEFDENEEYEVGGEDEEEKKCGVESNNISCSNKKKYINYTEPKGGYINQQAYNQTSETETKNTRRRNRNKSVDDRVKDNDYVKCHCVIF